MTRKALPLIILLSSLSLLFAVPQPFRFICGFLQVFVLPGLVFTHIIMGAGFTRTDRNFYSILISPIMISLLVIALTAITGDIYFSTRITLAVIYALYFALLVLRREDDSEEDGSEMPWQVLIVSLSFAGIILFSYMYNAFLLIRSDSWYHASVINEIINRGMPPREPWLADLPIKYMWFYHLFQMAWKELSGLSIFWAMGTFNVITAFIFPYLIARYISYYTDKKYLIISASIFAVAGLESVSWIFFPTGLIRTLFGEIRGVAEIQRMLSGVVINGSNVIHTLSPFGTWMVNLYDKFITVTAFSYSLNLFLASLIIALNRKFMRGSRVKSFIALFLIILGTILFHAVTGIALVMTVVGAGVLMILFGKYLVKDRQDLEGKYLLSAAAVLAASMGLPYIFSLGASGDGGNVISDHLHLGVRSILTILFPLVVLFFPVRMALRKIAGRRDYRSAVLICWSATLLISAITINLPTVNESKLIFPLFLIIGPPIYIEIVEKVRESSGLRRVFIILSIIVLFLVPPVLTIRGFIIQEPDTDLLLRRDNITEEDRRFFVWIKENTPDDSVIIENNIYHLVPVFADRRNFYSTQGVIRMLGYGEEKMEMYEKIQSSLYGKDGFSEDTIREMSKVCPKLYVALWREDLESSPWLSDRFSEDSKYFRRVFGSERVSLYILREDMD